ncbi:MAG: hypothetical protein Tsb002_11490 [Wenzhouxiangellaceae bacterium]
MGVAGRILKPAAHFMWLLLLGAGMARAQTINYDVLFDLDRNNASGCTAPVADPAAGISGYERRLRATVDTTLTQVTGVTIESCNGGSFGAPVPVDGSYPVGLNNGIDGGDVIELSVSLAQLQPDGNNVVRIAYVASDDVDSDILLTTDGSAAGQTILLGLPIAVPTLSAIGIAILLTLLLLLAWRRHRAMGSMLSIMLLIVAAGVVVAMVFDSDGDVSDWTGIDPRAIDPAGDSTSGSGSLDILAGFVALDNDTVFLRMDVGDMENTPPIAADDAFSVDEDNPLNVAAPGVLANDSDPDMDPMTAVLVSGPANAAAFTLNADGSFNYTPAANFNGADSFTYTANDGTGPSAPATVTITVNPVNDPPSAADDAATTLEDNPVVIDVLANDSDIDGNLAPASVSITTPAANGGTVVNNATGEITYTKNADFNGSDSFVYEVCDDGTPLPAQCATATVTVTITSVNDAPSFTPGGDVTVNEDSGAFNAAWATAISAGPADEAGQNLNFNITANDNPGLFATAPAIDAGGNLSFTPAADLSGSASITVQLMDDGGTANGGVDTSAPVSFVITVNPVNDAPSFTAGSDVTVLEDSGASTTPAWATAISPGPADEAGQMLTFNITANDNPGLFSAAPAIDATGTLTFTPAANAFGTANITVELMDDGGTINGGVDTSAPATFAINITGINDAPSFIPGMNPSIDEDSGAQDNPWATGISAGPANEAGQSLTFVVAEVSRDSTLTFTAAPAVSNTTGNLSFAAAANAYGSATYNVSLVDGGGTANGGIDTFGPVTLTLTVNPLNDGPTVGMAPSYTATTNIQINVPAASGLLLGASDDATEAADPAGPAAPGTNLTIGNGGNPAPTTTANGGNLTINTADGSFAYNPPAGFTGADSFTYVICDDGIGAPGPICSAPITVNITVSGPAVWFIDNAAPAGANNGRLTSPFESLNAFNGSALPAAGDFIFLATGSGPYNDGATGFTLLDNQTLFGQGTTGTTFDAFTGITAAPNSAPRPTLGGTDPVVTATTNAIVVNTTAGNSNTLRGFNIGNTTNGSGLQGNMRGTLNVSEVDITGDGSLMDIFGSNTGVLNANFGVLSSNNAATTVVTSVFDMAGGSLSALSTSITNPAAAAINLQNNPGVQFNFGNLATILTTNGFGIRSNNGGDITISPPAPITIQTNGGAALDLTGGTYTGFNFSSLSASNTVTGISLNNTAGFISCGGGNITNTTGDAVVITGGSNNITLGTFITNTAGRSVSVTGHTGGNVVFNQISDTGSGVFVNNNPGTTLFFSGTMNLNTGANNAFTATNGGTIDITGMNNMVTTTTGTAVTIQDVAIRNTGVTFQSVSANGSANGINLANTGNGPFSITGNGTCTCTAASAANCSGGIIQNSTVTGISLLATNGGVSLNCARIQNTAGDGISGMNVTNLSIQNSVIIDAGDAVGEDGIDIDGLFGTGNLISNSSVTRSAEFNVNIENNTATNVAPGIPDTLMVSNSTFGDNEFNGTGADGIFFGGLGTANMRLDVNGINCTDCRTDGIQADAGNSSTVESVVTNSTFNSNNIGLNISGANTATMSYDVNNNPSFTAHTSNIINIAHGVGNGTVDGRVMNNPSLNGSSMGNGVRNVFEGQAAEGPIARTLIDNNRISDFNNPYGIDASARAGTASLNITIEDNLIDMPGAFALEGVNVRSGNGTAGETSLVCLDIENLAAAGGGGSNNATGGAGIEGYELQQRTGTTFQLEGLNDSDCSGSACNGTVDTQVEEFLTDTNTGTADVRTAGRIVNYTHAASCAMPVL